MALKPYRHLAEFLSGWFHQDFDIEGDSIEAIVAAFKRSADAAQRAAVRTDIERLLHERGHRIEHQFEQLFALDIDPLGFAPSVKAFLEVIARELA